MPKNSFETLRRWAQKQGVELALFEQIDSTNREAHEPRYGSGALIVAHQQSAGRGQRGHHWSSAPGENLTFSVVLEPKFLEPAAQFCLHQIASLALVDTLEELDIEVQIKWPNDIYVEGQKMAGILIENDLAGEQILRSVVGIGLNVNQTKFPDDLPNPTSIALQKGAPHNSAELLERLYSHLEKRYGQLGRGMRSELETDYLERLWRWGESHWFREVATETLFRGIILGVGPMGELQLLHEVQQDDTTSAQNDPVTQQEQIGEAKEDVPFRAYLFKEVEYLLEPPAGSDSCST